MLKMWHQRMKVSGICPVRSVSNLISPGSDARHLYPGMCQHVSGEGRFSLIGTLHVT